MAVRPEQHVKIMHNLALNIYLSPLQSRNVEKNIVHGIIKRRGKDDGVKSKHINNNKNEPLSPEKKKTGKHSYKSHEKNNH